MRQLALRGDGRVELVDTADPVAGPAEALVRIEATSLCGSERGALLSGLPSGNAGHEACGVIESLPPDAPFALGERVGISAIRGCGTCRECSAGRETRCLQGPSLQLGLHADRAAVALSTLRRLPPRTDAVTGVLLSGDVLGVPVRALRRAPSAENATVVVLGLGPVGLSHVAVRALQGDTVVGIDPSAARRAMAERLGARHTHHPDDANAGGATLVIEATGHPECVERAFELAATGGTVLQSGECATATLRPSAMIVHREVTYTGAWYYATEDYPEMLRLHRDGLDIRRLVTDELPAGQAQTAVERFLAADSGKVMLRWSDS